MNLNFEEMGENERLSDVPTEDSKGIDSDELLDPPIQSIGDVMDVTHDGKIKKEILQVGEGVKKPKLNYIARVIYQAYFFDHTEFDSSSGEVVDLALGDISWPEGLWKGIEEMRKNEIAKIKIKKKYGFGRKQNRDKMRYPKGYEVEGSEERKRLESKGVIYQVTLVDWIERVDVEANGDLIKTFISKPQRREWETPKEIDEVTFNVKVYQQEEKPLFHRDQWSITVDSSELTLTLRKVLESLKRQEKSATVVKHSMINSDDPTFWEQLSEGFDREKDVTVEMELFRLVKVEDWFKDQTTFKRVLRKGKGKSPNIDSTVKLRMKITVNGEKVVTSNYNEGDAATAEDQTSLSEEQKQELSKDPSLYEFSLFEYKLPSLITKVVKSMKTNEVCEVVTTKIEKLQTNFKNSYFDQYEAFKAGDKVSFVITLVDLDETSYFYRMKVAEKLARIKQLKDIAGQFFKQGNFAKAAKLYQRINGYYNFGDATNNYAKEDEEDETFKTLNQELQSFKLVCFNNLVVCKFKLKEFESIVGITDQILAMDPHNSKALYFRGKALLETQEYDKAVECLTQMVLHDPGNADGKNELARAKKVRKDFISKQSSLYSKFFSS